MEGKSARIVTFDTAEFRQFDRGYAVTSHSSQGLTAGRVLVHIDTDSSGSLINNRLAYVSISRASEDARIYTNNAETLGEKLSTDLMKTAAVELQNNNANRNLTRALHRAGIQPDNPRVEIDLPGIGL